MEIKQLRYFVRVAELSSIAKASDLLNIAPPTLSRQISALEAGLKTNLFDRHGRGVSLTIPGRRFLDHARDILHAADSALDSLRRDQSGYEGRVISGFTPSIGRALIPTFLDAFTDQFPKANLSIVEGYSASLSEQVLTGKLDFAILLNPVTSQNLIVDPIGAQGLFLIGAQPVGPSIEEISLAAIANVRLVMPHTSHTIRPFLEYEAARLGVQLNIAVEIDAVRSIVDVVRRGRGYTVMPANSLGLDDHDSLSWQRIVSPTIEVTVCSIRPDRRPQTALSIEAAELARQTLANILADPR